MRVSAADTVRIRKKQERDTPIFTRSEMKLKDINRIKNSQRHAKMATHEEREIRRSKRLQLD